MLWSAEHSILVRTRAWCDLPFESGQKCPAFLNNQFLLGIADARVLVWKDPPPLPNHHTHNSGVFSVPHQPALDCGLAIAHKPFCFGGDKYTYTSYRGGGGNSAGGIFCGENSVFQLGAEFSPHFSRGGAEFSPCGILPV